MNSGTLIRIFLGLFLVALGIFLFLVPLLLWFLYSEWVRMNYDFQIHLPGGGPSNWPNDPILSFLGSWCGTFFLVAGGVYALFRASQLFRQAQFLDRAKGGEEKSPVEDRLDELERLKRRDMVTPEEYAAKRQEILKDL